MRLNRPETTEVKDFRKVARRTGYLYIGPRYAVTLVDSQQKIEESIKIHAFGLQSALLNRMTASVCVVGRGKHQSHHLPTLEPYTFS